jgi:hypothetical protein
MLKKSRRDLLKAGSVLTVSAATANALPSFIHAEDPYEDAVLVDGVPDSIEPGSFTIAVLPDTQNYSEHFPETFLAQTKKYTSM